MDRSNHTLDSLPLELLETIIKHLDGRSSVNLLISSKTIIRRLQSNPSFWKHVCRSLDLCSYEWTRGEDVSNSAEFWKSIYSRFVDINSALSKDGTLFEGQRILSDLSCFDQMNKNVDFDQLFNLNQQVVNFPVERKPLKNFKTLRKKLISECIISYGLSEEFFVLILSSSTSYKSHAAVWRLSEDITYSYSLSSKDLGNIWLACSEDILLVGDTLVLMASQAQPSNFFNEGSPNNSDLIHFYNLKSKSLVGRFSLTENYVRFLPLILKDGGGSKLFHWKGTILAVCPEIENSYYQSSPELGGRIVLRFFDLNLLNQQENKPLQIGEYLVQDVALKQPYSFMASDQKGPNIVLSFSKQTTEQLSQQFLFVSLENKAELLQSILTFDCSNMSRIPSLLETEESVRREQCLLAVGGRAQFCVMDSAGLVTVTKGAAVERQFFPVYGLCDDFDTFYDELHIYNDRIVVLKIFLNMELSLGRKNTILSVSDMEGHLLWKIKTNPILFNIDERLYLSPMFGNILVSDAKKVAIYSLATGRLINTIHYQKYKRLSREINRGAPHFSPYAQTGVSVWDLRAIRLHDRNMLVVVHDVERINPNIVDFYKL